MKWKKKFYLCFITIFRGVAIAVTLLMMLLLVQNTGWLVNKIERYSLYQDWENYYGVSISPDIDMSDESMQKLDDALVAFFKATNGDQSILLSVGSQVELYNDGFINDEELDVKDYVITVNETYLKEHPILDIDGKKVEISGDKDENYLLVPVGYQDKSQEIKEYYEKDNTFLRYYIDDLKKMGIDAAHNQQHETVPLNIIYIADGQTYDVPNLSEYGKLNGVIKNPLIDIITTENVSIAQIPSYVTNQDYLLKINSPMEIEAIKQTMKETGLEEFIMKFDPIINQYYAGLRELIIILLIQIVIAIAMQCAIYLVEKRLFCIDTEKRIVGCVVVSWCIALCLILSVHWYFSISLLLSIIILLLLDSLIIRCKFLKTLSEL